MLSCVREISLPSNGEGLTIYTLVNLKVQMSLARNGTGISVGANLAGNSVKLGGIASACPANSAG